MNTPHGPNSIYFHFGFIHNFFLYFNAEVTILRLIPQVPQNEDTIAVKLIQAHRTHLIKKLNIEKEKKIDTVITGNGQEKLTLEFSADETKVLKRRSDSIRQQIQQATMVETSGSVWEILCHPWVANTNMGI